VTWFEGMRLVDALDIAIVAWLYYRALVILRGTRAIQVLGGILALGLLYLAGRLAGLQTVTFVMDEFSIYLVLAILILFQEDIRRALARFGDPLLGGSSRPERSSVFQEIARAAFRLADQGQGALIAVEREASLDELQHDATRIDGALSEELLVALFQKTSPVHDGAVVVRGDRVAFAGAFLPLTRRSDLERSLGTRHRAALGETEQTDALVFVVSEERRAVSIAFRGELHPVATPDELRIEVRRLLQLEFEEKQAGRTGAFRPVRSGDEANP
jgi:diadenylate cyclase